MASPLVDSRGKTSPPQALKRFLKKVVREESLVSRRLEATSIHDLRVALRRCRSLAEGFGAMDDHRAWRRLHKSAKELQTGLAGLRDVHVMSGLVRRLKLTATAEREAVIEELRRDEKRAARKAKRALKTFSRKKWKRWGRRLPRRADKIDATPAAFAQLAMERLREVSRRERRWRDSGSQVAAHSLRIAVKRFRYTLQSFLPMQYSAWEGDLKKMQDALGEIHDLDVLRAWLLKVAKSHSLSHATVQEWFARIASARAERVARYRKVVSGSGRRMVYGPHPPVLWERWRSEIDQAGGISSPTHEESSA